MTLMNRIRCCLHIGSRCGFTLLELLLVTAILGVLGAAVGACIVGGVRVWDAARSFGEPETDALIGLSLLQTDLVNSFGFDPVPFQGGATHVRFPALVSSGAGDGAPSVAGGAYGIGTIAYAFDAAQGRLVRQTVPFAEGGGASAVSETVATGLRSCTFHFRDHADGADDATWVDAWNSFTNRPALVEIVLEFNEPEARVERTVYLPVRGES